MTLLLTQAVAKLIFCPGGKNAELLRQKAEPLTFQSELTEKIVSFKRLPWYETPREILYPDGCNFNVGHDELIIGNFGPDNIYNEDTEYF